MAAHGCGLSLRAGDSTAAEGGKEEAKTRVGEGQGLGDCLPQDRGAWRTGETEAFGLAWDLEGVRPLGKGAGSFSGGSRKGTLGVTPGAGVLAWEGRGGKTLSVPASSP